MTAETVLQWASQTGFSITVLIGIILLVRRPFARRFGAGAVYALWLLPFMRLFLPPITLPILKTEISLGQVSPVLDTTSLIIPVAERVVNESTPFVQSQAFLWSLLAVWISGAALWLVWQLLRQRQYMETLSSQCHTLTGPSVLLAQRAMQAAGLKAMPTLLTAETQVGPLVTGLIRPVIILPHDFSTHYHPQQQYFALLHEMTHIKRRDLWASFAVLMFRAVNWPNPIVHIAAKQFRTDQESACDATVLKQNDARNYAHDYAATLLHAAKTVMQPRAVMPLGLTIYHPLKERLMMIENQKRKTGPLSRWTAGLLILGVAGLSAPITLAAGPEKKELAGEAQTKHKSKKVIKSVEVVDGKKVQTHYEVITDENGTRAYSIAENGARTEIDPEIIEDKHVIVIKNGEGTHGAHVEKKIKIMSQSGETMDMDIESLIGERGQGKKVIIKTMKDGEPHGDHKVKVYNFSSSEDIDIQIDEDGFMMGQHGAHTQAMVSAASGLLDGVNDDELSEKTKRKLKKARKALKEAEEAILAEAEK